MNKALSEIYDFKEFKKLLEVPAPSKKLKRMENYLINMPWGDASEGENSIYFNKEGVKVVIEQDNIGNLYITKGEALLYPCVVAHYDENQHSRSEGYTVHKSGDVLFGFDPNAKRQCGAGFDDKCGIYACYLAMKKYDAVKVALFVDEEIGCVGSSNASMDFFNDVAFVAQLDKSVYGGKSIFTEETNYIEVLSDEFKGKVAPYLEKYGYEMGAGTYTDVGMLAENGIGVCVFNMSCGYLNEHSSNEICFEGLYLKALDLLDEIIRDFSDKRWEHKDSAIQQYGYIDYGEDMDEDIVYMVASGEQLNKSQFAQFKNIILGCRFKKGKRDVYNIGLQYAYGNKKYPWEYFLNKISEFKFKDYTDYLKWYFSENPESTEKPDYADEYLNSTYGVKSVRSMKRSGWIGDYEYEAMYCIALFNDGKIADARNELLSLLNEGKYGQVDYVMSAVSQLHSSNSHIISLLMEVYNEMEELRDE